MNYNKKIDVHAHILTKSYYDYLDKYEDPEPDHFATPKWDEKAHLKLMDNLGVACSVVSVSSPQIIRCDPEERLRIVNNMNSEALEVIGRHPDRMGLFASLPLPDVDAAVSIAGAMLSTDGVRGIGLLTNYDGIYLGSPKLDPLMEYLNAQKAIVCVHPTMPDTLPGDAVPDMPIPVMDYLMDTTRAFTNMVWNDKFIQYPDIKWIWPHGASFITILSDRFNSFSVLAKKNGNKHKLDYFGALKHCWFDTAGFSEPKQLHDMKLDIPTNHFLYGSDCPYTPTVACMALAGQLEKTDVLTKKEKQMMFTDNAVSLFADSDAKVQGTGHAVSAKMKRSTIGTGMNLFEKYSKK